MIDWRTISLKDLAGFISEELRKAGVDTVLVGGACVSIYTNNEYQSYDLDFITNARIQLVKKTLKNLGFSEKNRYFVHEDCPWFVEFVSYPVAVGEETVHQFKDLKTSMGTITMLTAVDSVKDRLASFYHWNDSQGLEQAIQICKEHPIDFEEIERWSKVEGHLEKFDVFSARIRLLVQ